MGPRMPQAGLRKVAIFAGLLLALWVGPGRAEDPEPQPKRIAAAAVLESIATACNERRYSDVSEFLHPTLRKTWIDIGYKVKDYCDTLTRDGTLKKVRIDKAEEGDDYAVVAVTYIFHGGAEQEDRAVFVRDKGLWKLSS